MNKKLVGIILSVALGGILFSCGEKPTAITDPIKEITVPTQVEPSRTTVDPTPVEPTIVDPTPIDPTPVDPTPVDPTPVDPTPVDPTPVDPTPVDPTPVDPTPIVPTPVDPTPIDPTPVDPTPIDPTPVDPTPVDPTPIDQEESITFDKNDIYFYVGDLTSVTATVSNPVEGSDFSWASSDENVLRIIPDGYTCTIEGLMKGLAILSFKDNETGLSYSINVYVQMRDTSHCVQIDSINKAGIYSVYGKVIALGRKSYVIEDSTGYLYCYTTLFPNVELGNSYILTGEISTVGSALRLNNPSVVLLSYGDYEENKNVLYYSGEYINKIIADNNFKVTNVHVFGELSYSNNELVLSKISRTDAKILIDTTIDFDKLIGKNVEVFGYVCGIENGTFKLVATSISDMSIKVPLTWVSITNEAKVKEGNSIQLYLDFAPYNANSELNFYWTTSDSNIATISQFGVLTGNIAGETLGRVIASNGVYCEFKVTVTEPDGIKLLNIKLDQSSLALRAGSSEKITYKRVPENATLGIDLKFKSENNKIATVDNDGLVKAIAVGKTKINVTNKYQSFNLNISVEVFDGIISGYQLATRSSDDLTHTVTSFEEAQEQISLAVVARRTSTKIKFAFNTTQTKIESYLYNGFVLDETLKNYFFSELDYDGKYYTYSVGFHYVGAKTATRVVKQTEEEKYYDLDNLNYLLRNNIVKNSASKRSSTFDNFSINKKHKAELEVYNSQDLFFAVEYNYLPVFKDKQTKAAVFYDEAKDILRNIISEDMNNYQKILSIYDFVCSNTNYNYDSLYDNGDYHELKEYYLEGFFENNGAGVCSCFSKMISLLCGIENIPCYWVWGFTEDVGHAYNYVNIEGNWYLLCSTFGQGMISKENVRAYFNHNIELTMYNSFLVDVDYFKDNGQDFIAIEYPTINAEMKANKKTYKDIFDKDYISTSSNFTLNFKSEEDVNNFANECKKLGLKSNFQFAFAIGNNSIIQSDILSALYDVGYTGEFLVTSLMRDSKLINYVLYFA